MKTFKVLCMVSVAIFVMAFVPKKIINKGKVKATTKAMVTQGYKVGDMVEDFSLENVDGKKISLSDYKTKEGVIVIFTCNSCPFAKAYEDRIIALDKKYATKGVPVLAINPNNPKVKPDDSFDAMKERAKQKKYTFPYLFDAEQKVFPVFGATKTPHVFLLENTKRGVEVKYIGAIDDNAFDATQVKEKFLEKAVDAMLKGEEIATKETKAIGCSIKE